MSNPLPQSGSPAPTTTGLRWNWGLRLAGALIALQGACALEVDATYVERLGSGVYLAAQIPRRLVATTVALALLLFLRPRPVHALAAGLGSLALLFLSCGYNSANFHLLQALLAAAAGFLAAFELARGSRSSRVLARFALVASTLLLVEGAFATLARSHAVGYTLAARLWFARYWHPLNALGYRDVEHVQDGRKDLFVLGDSFVAGVGIADPAERFSDRLQALVGARYQVHNLGSNGADTRRELELLATYPSRPDVLVLSYYINDITGAAAAHRQAVPTYRPYANLPRAVAWTVSRSYALDFAYWLLPQKDLVQEGRALEHAFAQPEVVAQHERDLRALIDWGRARGAKVLAVVFPNLVRPEAGAPWVEPALRVFGQNQVPTVDVRELVKDLSTAARIVNVNDPHPSPLLHQRVAEALNAKLSAGE